MSTHREECLTPLRMYHTDVSAGQRTPALGNGHRHWVTGTTYGLRLTATKD